MSSVAPNEGTGTRSPFHLAIRVHDLGLAETFYCESLGAGIGRRSERWIDFDLSGHQITVHLDESMTPPGEATNPVDGDHVPIPHFGVVQEIDAWRSMADRLAALGTEFVIAPRVRFEGEVGEQGTFFLSDPSGNALEFKGFADMAQLFAS